MGYEGLGMIAGAFTTLSFLPQAITVYRTKSTRDISLPMYIILNFGLFLWIIYGFLNDAASVYVWNGVTCILATAILSMKIYWEHIKKPAMAVKTIDVTENGHENGNGNGNGHISEDDNHNTIEVSAGDHDHEQQHTVDSEPDGPSSDGEHPH